MLSEFLKDYLPIIIFLIIALGLSCAFVVVNFILSPKKPDPEKLSAYECGFEPFEDSRMEFDVRFYLVAILFIVFDNGMYGTIRMHQERDYPSHVYGTALKNPDFAALAKAYGLHAETVTSTRDIRGAIKRCIDQNSASLIHIKVDPEAITTRTTLTAIRNKAMSENKA